MYCAPRSVPTKTPVGLPTPDERPLAPSVPLDASDSSQAPAHVVPIAVLKMEKPDCRHVSPSTAFPFPASRRFTLIAPALPLTIQLRWKPMVFVAATRMVVLRTVSSSGTRELTVSHGCTRYLEALLERHQGKVSHAAVEADVDRVSLYRLMRKHGLKPDER